MYAELKKTNVFFFFSYNNFILTLKIHIMKVKKGMKLVFNDRSEVIIKASTDRINGRIVTDSKEYSVDFIMRWLTFGFVKLEKG